MHACVVLVCMYCAVCGCMCRCVCVGGRAFIANPDIVRCFFPRPRPQSPASYKQSKSHIFETRPRPSALSS